MREPVRDKERLRHIYEENDLPPLKARIKQYLSEMD